MREPMDRIAAALERIATAQETLAGVPVKFWMRQPCDLCGEELGYVTEKNGQDVVRCSSCDAYVYTRPKG